MSCGDNYNATNLYRNTDGATYPYNDPAGYITITDNDIPDEMHYYYFYNWELRGPSCISARTPVDVMISGGPLASFTSSQNIKARAYSYSHEVREKTCGVWDKIVSQEYEDMRYKSDFRSSL